MKYLRLLAVLGALSLMIGELWRSWGAGRHPLFILDDMLAGGFMLAAAWQCSAIRSAIEQHSPHLGA